MISIELNSFNFLVKSNLSIIESCKFLGVLIPRFCYHEKLSVAASCRMCIVEIEKLPKPVTACSTDISSNIIIRTNSPFVKKARENILEALLLNHPLDCPICDQAGECDLQDQVKLYGNAHTRFYSNNKRIVEDKICGPLIKTIMTRCIHCTRCVRFASEISGIDFLGTLNRGVSTEIGSYISKLFNSEVSGNVIDLCPVGKINTVNFSKNIKKAKGALTSNAQAFKIRPWELKTIDTIDTLDSLGSNIFLNFKEQEIVRVLPKINDNLNEIWISDKTRFSFDSLLNNRLQNPLKVSNKKSINQYLNIKNNLYNKLFNKYDINFSNIFTNYSLNYLDFIDNSITYLESSYLENCDFIDVWTNLSLSLIEKTSVNKKKLKTTFIINENIDLESLMALKLLSKYKNIIEIALFENTSKLQNFHLFWGSDKVNKINSEIKNCFLFTTNMKIENTLLNVKLQTKLATKNFTVLSYGLNSPNTFPITCVNLNIKSIVELFEAKQVKTSSTISKTFSPLFFFGNSFNTRCSTPYSLILNFIKNSFPSAICVNLKHESNTSSIFFSNIRQLNKNLLLKSNSLVLFNLDTNLNLSKILSQKLNIFNDQNYFLDSCFCFNNYNPSINFWNKIYTKINKFFFVPSLNSIEFKSTYLNLEERPQQTQTLKVKSYFSLKDMVELFLNKTKIFQKVNNYFIVEENEYQYSTILHDTQEILELQFLFELVEKNFLFEKIKISFSLDLNSKFDVLTTSKYFKYPFKNYIDDFYKTNIYTENSNMMTKCSREARKLINNF